MFDSLQNDYTTGRCALQYKLISIVTMATWWVPDLPDIKGFAGHHWHSILIFANGAGLVCMIQQAYKRTRLSSWP